MGSPLKELRQYGSYLSAPAPLDENTDCLEAARATVLMKERSRGWAWPNFSGHAAVATRCGRFMQLFQRAPHGANTHAFKGLQNYEFLNL